MAQHQDLCLLPALRPAQQHEPTEQPIHDQVQQASRHEGSSSRTRRSTKREVTASFALSGTAQGAQLRFGIAFCAASGRCLIRRSGNADDLVDLAARNAEAIGAGHSFIIFLREGYPVNVLNAVKQVPEVCAAYCATANSVEVLIAQTDLGRAIISVVDGMPPAGIESDADEAERKHLLRELGYKL